MRTRLFALLTLIFFSSCQSSNITDSLIPKQYKLLLEQAYNIASVKPDLAIKVTDSLLFSKKNNLDAATHCKLYQIKQRAYLAKSVSDSTMTFGDSVRVYAEKIGDSLAIVNSLLVLPDTYIDYSKRKSMNAYFPMALRLFNTPNTQKEYARILSLKVIQLENEGQYQSALDLLLKAYDIFIKSDTKKEEARIAQMIANVYGDLNNPLLAFKYYKIFEKKSLELNDSTFLASAYSNFGVYYRRLNKDSAIYYYNKAIDINNKLPFSLSKILPLYNLANLYFDKEDFAKAKLIYDSILVTCINHKYHEGTLMTYNGISTVWFKQKQYDKAIYFMKKSIHLADSLNMTSISLRLRPDLVSMLYSKGDYKSTADELFKMNHLNDSILSNQKQIALIELEKKYQAEAKEKENVYLHSQLNYRKSLIIILSLVAIILFLLLRQRNRLFKERDISYQAIMKKYKEEKDARERASSLASKVSISNYTPSLYDQILSYYEQEKPYLNSKFRVDDLAHVLNSTQKDIAHTLKMHLNLNFSSFTNKYRVEAARKMFEDEHYHNMKMEVIADQSGFGTIQSFYNAFESFTGVKPGYYRSQILSNHT